MSWIDNAANLNNIKVHGLYKIDHTDIVDQVGYFTNTLTNNYPSTTPTVPDGGSALTVTLDINSTFGSGYKSDAGAVFNITARVYSNLALTGGNLKLTSTAINSDTICVHADDAAKTCSPASGTSITCTSIDTVANGFKDIALTCYNMKISSSGSILSLIHI